MIKYSVYSWTSRHDGVLRNVNVSAIVYCTIEHHAMTLCWGMWMCLPVFIVLLNITPLHCVEECECVCQCLLYNWTSRHDTVLRNVNVSASVYCTVEHHAMTLCWGMWMCLPVFIVQLNITPWHCVEECECVCQCLLFSWTSRRDAVLRNVNVSTSVHTATSLDEG